MAKLHPGCKWDLNCLRYFFLKFAKMEEEKEFYQQILPYIQLSVLNLSKVFPRNEVTKKRVIPVLQQRKNSDITLSSEQIMYTFAQFTALVHSSVVHFFHYSLCGIDMTDFPPIFQM
jgi:hypothetical protein